MTKPARTKNQDAQGTKFPAEQKKGALERDLGERLGHAREVASREPSGNDGEHGGSDVGQDESSGSETIAVDPTRFPRDE